MCLQSHEVWSSEPGVLWPVVPVKAAHSAKVGEEAQQRACKLQEATRRAMFAPPWHSLQQTCVEQVTVASIAVAAGTCQPSPWASTAGTAEADSGRVPSLANSEAPAAGL